jgi:hypothetical protein
VRAGDAKCPFCGAEIVAAAVRPVSTTRNARLTRAAIVFATGTTIAACGGKETASTFDAGEDDASPSPTATVQPMYGGPPVDAGKDAIIDAADEDVMLPVMYGPAPVDSGNGD